MFAQFRNDKKGVWKCLELKLDNPSFKTAVLRMFALDFQARGAYVVDSPQYKNILNSITEFCEYFKKIHGTEGDW